MWLSRLHSLLIHRFSNFIYIHQMVLVIWSRSLADDVTIIDHRVKWSRQALHDMSNSWHAECRGGVLRTVRELSGNFTLSGEWLHWSKGILFLKLSGNTAWASWHLRCKDWSLPMFYFSTWHCSLWCGLVFKLFSVYLLSLLDSLCVCVWMH